MPVILHAGFIEMISEETAASIGIRRLVMKPVINQEMAKAVREAPDPAPVL